MLKDIRLVLIAVAAAVSMAACNKAENPGEVQKDVTAAQQEGNADVAEARQDASKEVTDANQQIAQAGSDVAINFQISAKNANIAGIANAGMYRRNPGK